MGTRSCARARHLTIDSRRPVHLMTGTPLPGVERRLIAAAVGCHKEAVRILGRNSLHILKDASHTIRSGASISRHRKCSQGRCSSTPPRRGDRAGYRWRQEPHPCYAIERGYRFKFPVRLFDFSLPHFCADRARFKHRR